MYSDASAESTAPRDLVEHHVAQSAKGARAMTDALLLLATRFAKGAAQLVRQEMWIVPNRPTARRVDDHTMHLTAAHHPACHHIRAAHTWCARWSHRIRSRKRSSSKDCSRRRAPGLRDRRAAPTLAHHTRTATQCIHRQPRIVGHRRTLAALKVARLASAFSERGTSAVSARPTGDAGVVESITPTPRAAKSGGAPWLPCCVPRTRAFRTSRPRTSSALHRAAESFTASRSARSAPRDRRCHAHPCPAPRRTAPRCSSRRSYPPRRARPPHNPDRGGAWCRSPRR